ncbi:MAG: Phage portal protein, lambda family [Syntrophorhabdus sp. PtaU1.Bin058]|nr:MAG: Phage portal protein, lambda family [Syntrophorhabdus sp. PtaU1.Bin058]
MNNTASGILTSAKRFITSPFRARVLEQQNTILRTNIKRAYAAAAMNRLTADWPTNNLSSDAEIRIDLKALRARSRNLSINTDHGRRFIWMVVSNVVGARGVGLSMRVKDANDSLDTVANKLIVDAFTRWAKRGTCDVTGELSWIDVQRLAMMNIPRDGEVIIRKVRGFDNPFAFALQLIEADHLDDTLNQSLPNGNEIRMGVERDPWGRPVAYHILTQHPGEYMYKANGNRYERIPATDINHAYVKERITQSRGVPWMHASMPRMKNVSGYEDAEIIGARASASKMGIVQSPKGNEFAGDDVDEKGNVIQEVEPGTVTQLPKGWEWKEFDPTHPAGNFGPFMKATLRSIASGLLVSYEGLTGDLEGVTYSSIRAGLLAERDIWRLFQKWFIDTVLTDIFESWLKMALFTQQIKLPFSKYEKFNSPIWRPRGWAWVDPLKDITALEKGIALGVDSRTNALLEEGESLEETFEELATEEKLADEKKISIKPGTTQSIDQALLTDEPSGKSGKGGTQ